MQQQESMQTDGSFYGFSRQPRNRQGKEQRNAPRVNKNNNKYIYIINSLFFTSVNKAFSELLKHAIIQVLNAIQPKLKGF